MTSAETLITTQLIQGANTFIFRGLAIIKIIIHKPNLVIHLKPQLEQILIQLYLLIPQQERSQSVFGLLISRVLQMLRILLVPMDP
jgi:hypothetical protein